MDYKPFVREVSGQILYSLGQLRSRRIAKGFEIAYGL